MLLTKHQKRKKKKGLCITRYCTNRKAKDRNLCYTCVNRRWREKNPLKASYKDWKFNARRRGKEFTITFEEFRKFAAKAEYHKRGIKKNCYHIDRIDESKGYISGNIQYLKNHENVKKYHDKNKTYVVDWEPENDESEEPPF